MSYQRQGNLIVPATYNQQRTAPSSFVKKLQDRFSTDMHVEWNNKKNRWVIEQCTEHHASGIGESGETIHSHLCRRIYVWMVRDEKSGDFMELSGSVLDKVSEMETYRKYGTGEAALARFLLESKNFDAEKEQKDRAEARDVIRHSSKFNRTTWNKLLTLMGKHDLRPNK